MIASDQVYIRRVRVIGQTVDPLPARHHLSTSIDPNLLDLIGLSPECTLCIRSLSDPKPGAFHFDNSNSNPTWKYALLESMRRLAQTAIHPLQGPVPANAQAVIFLDRSELLACMAMDWCAGELISRWWWKSLFRSGDVDRAVIGAWLQSPQEIPTALQRLQTKQHSTPFIRKLDDQSLNEIFEKLVVTYGLSELQRLTGQQQMERSTSIPKTGHSAPWHFYVHDPAIEQLPAHRQLVLGVGLMLYSNPSVVRARSFAMRVMEWQAATGDFDPDDPSRIGERLAPGTEKAFKSSGHRSRSNSQDMQVNEITTNIAVRNSLSASKEAGTIPENIASTAKQARVNYVETSTASADVEEDARIITSQFGGICYFVNLGLFLHLYGDFTTPLQPGIDLPIWDFVALVAQQILGDDVTRDPLWALLAELAGRNEQEAPGTDFQPEEHESLQTWLDELMIIVRSRLRSALGIDHEEIMPFFKQPARIVITATRFDAYFELATLPIEIRLSGLDRDPGWVPAAGKFVGFHYE